MVNWAARQNPCFDERDLYRWICTAGFVQLDVQMLYSIKYCVQAGIGWYRLDLPSVGPRGMLEQGDALERPLGWNDISRSQDLLSEPAGSACGTV